MEKWLSDLRKLYVNYNIENENFASLVAFLRKWLLIDVILIEDFEKVRNDVIIAIVYKQ